MKLKITESVNVASSDVYEKLALLGYACILAANDFHFIHLNASGENFSEIHADANSNYYELQYFADFCFETALEGNIKIENGTNAFSILADNGLDWKVQTKTDYDLKTAYTTMSDILTVIVAMIDDLLNTENITSDIEACLQSKLRQFTSAVNYRIASRLK